jgi:hypothetical protein
MTATHLGRVLWRETMTKDLEKAKRFYGGLFGWSFENFAGGDPNDPYPMIKVSGKTVGGMMAMKPGMSMPCYWTSYVSVADVDASCGAAKAGGGAVPWGPVDIPSVGRMAMVAGKDGACLSIMKAEGDGMAPGGRPGVGEFCWETLSAANVDEAKTFWTKVVPSWKAAAGINGVLTFAVGEGMENQVADIQPAKNGPPNWFTYVVVEKIEPALAKAEKLGGKTMMPAMAIPSVGRIAGIMDDQGAALGLFEPGGI